jgi:hypothetical protein
MTSEKRLADLTELENVLDTFGGNPGRWPAGKRERMMGFAASDADARRLLREAEALDAVLTRAAGPPVGNTSRLADRIAAAAAAQSGAADAGKGLVRSGAEIAAGDGKAGVVIAWPSSGPRSGQSGARSTSAARVADPAGTTAPRRDRLSGNWRTAAMMAASLLIGVFVGVMDLMPAQVTQFVAGVDSRAETTQALAFLQGDGILEFLDEGPQ